MAQGPAEVIFPPVSFYYSGCDFHSSTFFFDSWRVVSQTRLSKINSEQQTHSWQKPYY